jgi:hypothetical protein
MNEERFRCLEQKLHEALTDADFQAAAARANRSLDVERGGAALSEIRTAAQRAERFVPVIREAINKIRN